MTEQNSGSEIFKKKLSDAVFLARGAKQISGEFPQKDQKFPQDPQKTLEAIRARAKRRSLDLPQTPQTEEEAEAMRKSRENTRRKVLEMFGDDPLVKAGIEADKKRGQVRSSGPGDKKVNEVGKQKVQRIEKQGRPVPRNASAMVAA